MSRSPATFKQADIVRAVKAARACGLDVVATEISRDGKITLVHSGLATPTESSNPYDLWKAKDNARSA